MNTFYEPLLQLEAYTQIRERLKKEKKIQLITGCVDSQKTHLMYGLGRDWPVRLILTYNELKAKEIYEEDYRWLRKMGCDRTISPALVQQHAMCVARWIQCENAISEFGFIAKHPTTGAPIASPYVSMSRDFLKQVNQTWYQIAQFVRENSQSVISGPTPQDELMEKLLSGR